MVTVTVSPNQIIIIIIIIIILIHFWTHYLNHHYTVVQILVINIVICFASSYNVFRADDLKLL